MSRVLTNLVGCIFVVAVDVDQFYWVASKTLSGVASQIRNRTSSYIMNSACM